MIIDLKKEDSQWMYEVAEKAYGTSPWTEEQFREDFAQKTHYQKAIIVDGKKVGFIQYHLFLGQGEVINIAIDPYYQGKGLGEKLLMALPSAKTWLLEVRESNVKARHLYEKLKFKVIGRRRNYYRQPLEDAIIMERK